MARVCRYTSLSVCIRRHFHLFTHLDFTSAPRTPLVYCLLRMYVGRFTKRITPQLSIHSFHLNLCDHLTGGLPQGRFQTSQMAQQHFEVVRTGWKGQRKVWFYFCPQRPFYIDIFIIDSYFTRCIHSPSQVTYCIHSAPQITATRESAINSGWKVGCVFVLFL